MAEKISTTNNSPNFAQASTTEAVDKPAKAEGKQILVLGDDGKLDVASRKTGLGISIKRLAVRIATLFTPKDKSYWNKALGLDQDSRAAKAAEQFSNRFRTEGDQDTAQTKKSKIPSYVVATKAELDQAITHHNESYVKDFLEHKLNDVIRGMVASNKIGPASRMGSLIVKAAELEVKDKMLGKEDLVDKLNEFKEILKSDKLHDLELLQKGYAKRMIPSIGTNLSSTNQTKDLYHAFNKISKFCRAVPNASDKAREFCFLLLKERFSEAANGTDIATKFTKFYEGTWIEGGPESKLSDITGSDYDRGNAARIIYKASCAVLGKDPVL